MVHLPPRRTARTRLRAQFTVLPRDIDGWNELTDRMQPPIEPLHHSLGLHTEVRSEHLPELWEAFLQQVRVHGRFDEKWYQGWVARRYVPRRYANRIAGPTSTTPTRRRTTTSTAPHAPCCSASTSSSASTRDGSTALNASRTRSSGGYPSAGGVRRWA